LNAPAADERLVRDYLAAHNTLTLATSGTAGVWATAVFYVSEDNFDLCFKSDPRTRHGQDLAGNARVAGTVQDDGQDWSTIQGVQISGTCALVAEADFERVNTLYLRKYSFLENVASGPGDANERILAERLRSTPYYRLRPRRIRFIDNARGFGWKTEISLDR
jgi:uncharacterized protein YhbP (UPF0306 family)